MTNAQKTGLNYTQKVYTAATNAAKNSKKKYNTAYNTANNFIKQGYQESDLVKGYRGKSDELYGKAEAMGDFTYTSKYAPKAEDALETAKNMKFNMKYSLTDDPAYQSYRDQFVRQGQLAAQEAAGNAVAQTGGFGSTAAVAASQQAYNESLTQLNNIVPELYSQAYSREWNKFENERNTMFALADAYNNMDSQAYNQALSTWQNNFNQYITLAQAYNAKYEYLDAAERQEWNTKLNGLLEVLGVAKDQYQHDTSLRANAAQNYSSQANDIAQLEEQTRQAKAQEALEQQKINETRRSNLAAEAAAGKSTTTKSAPSGKTTTSKKTTTLPKLQTRNEFMSSAAHDGTYELYVAKQIKAWVDSGKLNGNDAKKLAKQYGVELE